MVKIPKNDQLQDAVEQWYQPVAQYGLNGSEYKFTDPRLQSFANVRLRYFTYSNPLFSSLLYLPSVQLAHYKSTALGCHYAKCQPPERVVIVCMYNNPYVSFLSKVSNGSAPFMVFLTVFSLMRPFTRKDSHVERTPTAQSIIHQHATKHCSYV